MSRFVAWGLAPLIPNSPIPDRLIGCSLHYNCTIMPTPLVECIPNFSEARRPQVIDAILEAIQSVPAVRILDRHSDRDHNRTVITFIGPPDAVEQAAFHAIATAARLIDLNHHIGVHPRVGATDVVPFVPISDVSMAECIQMAQRLGQRVGDELGIPVYLYEEAAARPERRNLENIRRGEFEALKEEIAMLDERCPDFGPCKIGPAGATVIGARQPLIAFNVYLTTDDVSIAQKIARAIRHSSGGLRFVKSMGIQVDGRAQVSMNLTNYRQTPIFRVVELIRREAARYGVAVHHSELVGLIPQDALVDSSVWYLQLDEFERNQILERRLFEIAGESQAESSAALGPRFLEDLASDSPTPGGGAAAAFTAAEAAALVAMVAQTTLGKKQYATVEEQMLAIIEQADQLRKELSSAVAEDMAVFEAYLAARRLPKDTPEQQETRSQAVLQATLNAAKAPLQVAKKAAHVTALAVEAARMGNANAIADAATATALARAALTGAGLNARANLKNMDPSLSAELLEQLAQVEQDFKQQEQTLRTVLKDRAGLHIL